MDEKWWFVADKSLKRQAKRTRMYYKLFRFESIHFLAIILATIPLKGSEAKMGRLILQSLLIMFVVASAAKADVCDSLRSENAKLNFKAAGILADHPVLTTVFAGCAAGAINEYEETRNGASASIVFMGCTGVACLFSPDGSCTDTAKRWFEVMLKKASLSDDAKSYGCSL